MVQPPRPGAQCRHQTPSGFSSSSICGNLQHIEQSPQLRPATIFGVRGSSLMMAIDYQIMGGNATMKLLRSRALDPRDRKARGRLAAPLALMHRGECGFDVSPEPISVEQRIGRSILDSFALMSASMPASVASFRAGLCRRGRISAFSISPRPGPCMADSIEVIRGPVRRLRHAQLHRRACHCTAKCRIMKTAHRLPTDKSTAVQADCTPVCKLAKGQAHGPPPCVRVAGFIFFGIGPILAPVKRSFARAQPDYCPWDWSNLKKARMTKIAARILVGH